jgi:hypothetical protein
MLIGDSKALVEKSARIVASLEPVSADEAHAPAHPLSAFP